MYVVDPKKFHAVLKAKGYRSIGELASFLGMHRNTVHYYLSGKGVFPASFERMLDALDVGPEEILQKKENASFSSVEQIASIIDTLHTAFPQVSFVLFGSRARGRGRRSSDWDIGVYSQAGLPHELYRERCQFNLE